MPISKEENLKIVKFHANRHELAARDVKGWELEDKVVSPDPQLNALSREFRRLGAEQARAYLKLTEYCLKKIEK